MLNLLLANFASVMSTIGRILLALVILMFMVLIHETGHYTAGKILGFQINEFAIGMGPKIFSRKKKNGEVISLRLLPLGGFCAFEGENEDGEENPKAFNKQKPWKRLIVLFSGAFFNFISAILIGIIAFSCYGDTFAQVSDVYEFAPSVNQQLQGGDLIYKINGKRVFVLDNISRYMKSDEMTFTVLRPTLDKETDTVTFEEVTITGLTKSDFVNCNVDEIITEIKSNDEEKRILQKGDWIYKVNNGNVLFKKGDFSNAVQNLTGEITLTVRVGNKFYDYTIDKSMLGSSVKFAENEYSGIGMGVDYVNQKIGFGEALVRVVPYCGEVAMLVLRTLGGLFTGMVGVNDIGGPISTIGITSQIVATGFGNILRLIVLISVNLAVFNLLPVPALDGCQMIFVIIEWIARKPINRKVQAYINGIGLIVLIGLMLLIDILKL